MHFLPSTENAPDIIRSIINISFEWFLCLQHYFLFGRANQLSGGNSSYEPKDHNLLRSNKEQQTQIHFSIISIKFNTIYKYFRNPTSPHKPEKYKTSNNNFHLPPTVSDDPVTGYGTLPVSNAYAHWQLPDEWSL